jgi:hypothetical protein
MSCLLLAVRLSGCVGRNDETADLERCQRLSLCEQVVFQASMAVPVLATKPRTSVAFTRVPFN